MFINAPCPLGIEYSPYLDLDLLCHMGRFKVRC